MKIIHKGTNPATVPLRATCAKCKTEVEFLPHEAKFTSDQRDGDFYTITCPVCSSKITKDVRGCAQPDYYPGY